MQITFTGRGLEVTESMKQFITEKLMKVPHLDMALQVNCEVGQTVSHKGSEKDFYLRVLITLPKAVVRMRKEGAEVYSLVDEMFPSLQKKLVQYKENFRKWEGAEQWPESTVVEEYIVPDDSSSAVYAGYLPQVRKKILTEMPPMSVTEAIERMELMDRDFFVFREVQSSKIAVVARMAGGYELIMTA